MNTILKNRVSAFIKYSGMSQSQFARNVDLCSVTISQWLGDKRIISINAENRIREFMTEYLTRVAEIING